MEDSEVGSEVEVAWVEKEEVWAAEEAGGWAAEAWEAGDWAAEAKEAEAKEAGPEADLAVKEGVKAVEGDLEEDSDRSRSTCIRLPHKEFDRSSDSSP